MTQGICKLLWVKAMMKDLGFAPTGAAMLLYYNNKSAIAIAHNHVEIDRYFIKEMSDDHIIEVPFLKSEEQLANILTRIVSSHVLF